MRARHACVHVATARMCLSVCLSVCAGLVNTDCHVLSGYTISIESEGGTSRTHSPQPEGGAAEPDGPRAVTNGDTILEGSWKVLDGHVRASDTILEGSWKVLDGAAGAMRYVSLDNTRGSVVEVWNSSWALEGCDIRAAGPWQVLLNPQPSTLKTKH